VFGIFFVPDIPAAIPELWRILCPGGKLAITTWDPDFFEPANSVFWNAVRDVKSELYKGFNPWDRISEPAALSEIFIEAGVPEPLIVAEQGTHPNASPEDWWTTLLGPGYRCTIEQMEPEMVENVRRVNDSFISNDQIRAVQTNVLYAVAEKF
jgi:SAM-dependent methyltransferase